MFKNVEFYLSAHMQLLLDDYYLVYAEWEKLYFSNDPSHRFMTNDEMFVCLCEHIGLSNVEKETISLKNSINRLRNDNNGKR